MDASAEVLQVGARVAGHADLQDIRTFRVHADFVGFPDDELPLRWDFRDVLEVKVDDEPTFIIDGEYEVSVYQSERDDDDRVDIAELSFNVAALYELPEGESGGKSYEREEMDAFAQTTGKLALYPYVRSLVADMTARLGLPGLVLPTTRVGIANVPSLRD